MRSPYSNFMLNEKYGTIVSVLIIVSLMIIEFASGERVSYH